MSVTAAKGFRAVGISAGLKRSGKPDLALVVNDGPAPATAGVFTTNRVVAAPVVWSRRIVERQAVEASKKPGAERDGRGRLEGGLPEGGHPEGSRLEGSRPEGVRAVVLNSGSANACTGPRGAQDVEATAAGVAEAVGCQAGQVLVCSTGVIGVPVDVPRLLAGVRTAVGSLAETEQAGHDAATAIMTTDTVRKEDALRIRAEDGQWTIGGMIKGVGMLAPGMATMIAVLTTDAAVTAQAAQRALSAAAARTVNRINSDGCMSTNDTVLLLASGASGISPAQADLDAAVEELLARLGRRLVADAEGATHDIAITVAGAASEEAAEAAARTVSSSNLLKCAVAGGDPNWGRVLAQLGTVPERVCPFDPEKVDVSINGVTIFRHGELGENRELVDMSPRETRIDIALNAGTARATVWTNDLTHGYVSINGDYTT